MVILAHHKVKTPDPGAIDFTILVEGVMALYALFVFKCVEVEKKMFVSFFSAFLKK